MIHAPGIHNVTEHIIFKNAYFLVCLLIAAVQIGQMSGWRMAIVPSLLAKTRSPLSCHIFFKQIVRTGGNSIKLFCGRNLPSLQNNYARNECVLLAH
jgi:hypothetical protein